MAVEVISIGLERERCCCDLCSVRTGSIIISAMWIILSTYNSISCGSQLLNLINDEKYNPDELASFGVRTDGNFWNVTKEFYTNHRALATDLTALLFMGEFINIQLSAICLYGTLKRGPSIKLRTWIWFNTFCAVLSGLFNIALATETYFTSTIGEGIVLVLLFLVIYGGYFWLIGVVYDYAKEIRQIEDGEAVHGPASFDFDGLYGDVGHGQMVTRKMKRSHKEDQNKDGDYVMSRVIQI